MKLKTTVERAWISAIIRTCWLVLSAIILLLLLAKTSLAAAPKEADEAMHKEMPTIIADFEDGAVGAGGQAVPVGFGSAFQFYYFETERLEALDHEYDRAAIDSILEESGEWVYPLLDEAGKVVSSAGIGKNDHDWGLWELPTDLSDEAIAFTIDEVAANEYLAAQGINDVGDIKHIHVPKGGHSRIDLLYFETAEENYIIPFSLNFYDLELENKKVYRAAEVLEKLAVQSAEERRAEIIWRVGDIFRLGEMYFSLAYLVFIGWLALSTVRIFSKATIGQKVFLSVFWASVSSNLLLGVIDFFPWTTQYYSYMLVGISVIGFSSLFGDAPPIQSTPRRTRIFIYLAPVYLLLLLIWVIALGFVAYMIAVILLSTVFGLIGAYFRLAKLHVVNGAILWVLGWHALLNGPAVLNGLVLLPAIVLMVSGLQSYRMPDTTRGLKFLQTR